jgi:hypothetical protein
VSPFSWTPPPPFDQRLRDILTVATDQRGAPDWYDLPAVVRNRLGPAVRALIGYGSWYTDGLRKPVSFADLYAVVDDYRRVHRRRTHRWWNRLLPPNVYFVWSDGEGHRALRGKYNVIDVADFERECGPHLRDVYNAGRMSKMVWLAWTADAATRDWVVTQLLMASRTLTPMALAALPARFALDDFTRELLAISYRGEARLEGWERVRQLQAVHLDLYRALHVVLLEAFGAATGLVETTGTGTFHKLDDPYWNDVARATRRLLARSRRRGYLRWPRIVLTEPNLLDLAVNEAERKAGVTVRVTPRLRRHPFLFGLPEFLRVLRERRGRERIRRRDRRPR